MVSAPFLLLLSACGRVWSCVPPAAQDPSADSITADQVAPPLAPARAPEPLADSWAQPWTWAAVVWVDGEQTTPQELTQIDADHEVGEEAAADAGKQVPAPQAASSLNQDVVLDSLSGVPVSIWAAAPGAVLSVPGGAPQVAGELQTCTVPATAQVGQWLVVTDVGSHSLLWGPDLVVRELQVSLGLEPWRVIVGVGLDRELLALQEASAIQRRLGEHGVAVVRLDQPGLVNLPFADLALGSIDLTEVLDGQSSVFVLLAQGQPPKVVPGGQPVVLLHAATQYFGVDLLPRAGRAGGPGARRQGKRGDGSRVRGKAGEGARRRTRAGQRPVDEQP